MAVIEEHIAALDRTFDALERGDLEGVTALLNENAHADCEFTSAIGSEVEGRTYRGAEEIRGWFADLIETMELRYEDRHYESPDEATVLFLATNKLRGKGSGAEVVREIGIVYELENGRVRRAVTYGTQDEARAAASGSHA